MFCRYGTEWAFQYARTSKQEEDLKRFVRDTMKDITVAIYKRVKMVV